VTLKTIIEELPAHLVWGPQGWQNIAITRVIAGDLMSDILVMVETEALLVTGLATDQSVRCADMVGASAVLVVNDKLPDPSMRLHAEAAGIPVLATPMPLFETCVTLNFLMDKHES